MIEGLLLAISVIIELYISCKIGAFLTGEEELEKGELIFGCVAAGILSMGVAFLQDSAYFGYAAWLLKVVGVAGILMILMKRHRLLCAIIGILVVHIFFCVDLATGFALITYQPKNFSTDKILYSNTIDRNTVFVILRSVVAALLSMAEGKRRMEDNRNNRNLLLLLDVLSGILLFFLVRKMMEGNTNLQVNYLFIFLLCGVLFGGATCIYHLSHSMREQARFMELKNQNIERNYQQIYEGQRQLEVAAHDFKNHINLLTKYLEEKDYYTALRYCRQLGKPLDLIKKKSWSGNAMLDTILNLKVEEAERKEIKVEMEVGKIGKAPMKDFDLCVVLSNLLDNAIEACAYVPIENRKIIIHIKMMRQMFVLKIVNSMARKPVLKNGVYKTIKDDKKVHGVGLESVQNAVAKYEGTLLLEHNEEEFSAVVTFHAD